MNNVVNETEPDKEFACQLQHVEADRLVVEYKNVFFLSTPPSSSDEEEEEDSVTTRMVVLEKEVNLLLRMRLNLTRRLFVKFKRNFVPLTLTR